LDTVSVFGIVRETDYFRRLLRFMARSFACLPAGRAEFLGNAYEGQFRHSLAINPCLTAGRLADIWRKKLCFAHNTQSLISYLIIGNITERFLSMGTCA
jgi:hypothetical protein